MGAICAAPGVVLVLALLLAGVAAGSAVLTMEFNTSSKDMLSEDLPYRRNGLALEAAFPGLKSDLLAIIESDDPARARRAAKALTAALEARADLFPSLHYPPSEEFFRRNGILYLTLEELEDLVLRLAEAAPLLVALRDRPPLAGIAHLLSLASEGDAEAASNLAGLERLLEEMLATVEALEAGHRRPIAWAALMSDEDEDLRNGRVQVIALRPKLDFTSLKPVGAAAQTVRDAYAALPEEERVATSLHLTGAALMFQEELESVESNMSWIGAIAFLAVACLLWIGLGSWRAAVALLATLLVGLAWTAGFAALAVGTLNLISVAFAVLFIGLGVDFGIHFQLRMMGETRGTLAEVLAATSGRCGGVLSLCAVSSAIGFYAFLPTEYRGLSELGLISGSAMFIALAATFTVLPAVLLLLRWAPGKPRRRSYGRSFAEVVLAAETSAKRRYKPVLLAAIVIGGGSAALLPTARFDDDPMNLRDPGSPAVRALTRFAGHGGLEPYAAEILTPSRAAARDLATRLALLDGVRKALTVDDLIPKEQGEKLALLADLDLFLPPGLFERKADTPDDDARRVSLRALRRQLDRPDGPFPDLAGRLSEALTPFERAEGDRLAELERMVLGDLDAQIAALEGALTAEPVTWESLPLSIKSLWIAPDGRARVSVLPAADLADQTARKDFVAAVQSLASGASGASVMIVEGGRAVITAFAEALLYAVGAIFLLLWVRLRSLGDALLVLAPLGLAGIVTVASASLLGWPFNFANVIVLPLLFGLGIDSNIHMVARARGEGGGPEEGRTLHAILLSSLTTISSFGALSFSAHPGTASMGKLLTLAIVLGLVASLFVLPALLVLRRRDRVSTDRH